MDRRKLADPKTRFYHQHKASGVVVADEGSQTSQRKPVVKESQALEVETPSGCKPRSEQPRDTPARKVHRSTNSAITQRSRFIACDEAVASHDPPKDHLKPQFSTYQQHFTPTKTSIAHTSSSQPLSPRNASPIDDSAGLQRESLQMMMILRPAQRSVRIYQNEIEVKMKRAAVDLATKQKLCLTLEADNARIRNIALLSNWITKSWYQIGSHLDAGSHNTWLERSDRHSGPIHTARKSFRGMACE